MLHPFRVIPVELWPLLDLYERVRQERMVKKAIREQQEREQKNSRQQTRQKTVQEQMRENVFRQFRGGYTGTSNR